MGAPILSFLRTDFILHRSGNIGVKCQTHVLRFVGYNLIYVLRELLIIVSFQMSSRSTPLGNEPCRQCTSFKSYFKENREKFKKDAQGVGYVFNLLQI